MRASIDPVAVRAAISSDPWTSVAYAFAAGACLAILEPRGRVARTIASTAGAIALAALREAVRQRIASQARSWIDDRVRSPQEPVFDL